MTTIFINFQHVFRSMKLAVDDSLSCLWGSGTWMQICRLDEALDEAMEDIDISQLYSYAIYVV